MTGVTTGITGTPAPTAPDLHVDAALLMSTPHAVVVHVRVLEPAGQESDDGLVIARRYCRQDSPHHAALMEAARSHRRSGAARLLARIDGVWQDLLHPRHAPGAVVRLGIA